MKAIALVSGGLDSILAARVVQGQGIGIIPLHFKIPFCQRNKQTAPEKNIHSLVKRGLGEELKIVELGADFLRLVLEPKHGFGANMNPCIDCKIFMLRKARELMGFWEAQFVVTGEVLGQRPMSQHRRALETIERESGLGGLLLRPLSAGLLTETLPESGFWVKRSKLFSFSGRSRRAQMGLAREFNIEGYSNPAGGCLLTDRNFSNRLRDLIGCQALSMENVALLKLGRHFRINPLAKLIVGRNEEEDKELELLAGPGDCLFMPDENTAGPTCLGRGEFNPELIQLSAQIACRYCDLNGLASARIIYYENALSRSPASALEVPAISEERLRALRL